ncbi:MAG: TRAP transporter substrate-binding protein DctP [Thermodesulfobacteriota bacterium]
MSRAILWAFCVALFVTADVPAASGQASRILFRISTENTPNHVQSQAVRRFARLLSGKVGDRIEVEYHDAATLFRDKDVFSALTEGKLEMAVPGTWHVARFQPDVNIFLMPVFYGRSAGENHAVLESDVGQELNRRIEEALGVRIPGKWLDLGHANLYTLSRRLAGLGEVRGLRIRVAGGKANEMRLDAAGADAITIPWPDFPLWLDRGQVDGVLTTHETVRSAMLWTHGIRYCLEDREYFPMYVPMISARVWTLLPEDVRLAIADAWEDTAVLEREMAAQAQIEAGEDLARHGVEIVIPDQADIAQWRKRLSSSNEAIITRIGLDKDLYARAVRILDR